MLTAAQRDELATRGYTYLRNVVAVDEASAIEDRIWAFLAKRGSNGAIAVAGRPVY
jgi:hypothetical protein